MIKIIDETPAPECVKRTLCRNCGVTLEYTPFDTRTEKRTNYTGSADIYTLIDCPKCNHTITVGY